VQVRPPVSRFLDQPPVFAFQPRIVIIVEIIEHVDVVPLAQKPFRQMRSDKSRASRDENFHRCKNITFEVWTASKTAARIVNQSFVFATRCLLPSSPLLLAC
jgi:hypothetical protein